MHLEFQRIPLRDSHINVCKQERLVMGFSEHNIQLPHIADYLSAKHILELKQIHSALIYETAQVLPGTQGDGIILDRPGQAAIIKTADCTPLFFWNKSYTLGGVIHVGWQGLHKGIEQELLKRLEQRDLPYSDFLFFMGPAIEKDCYEVGEDLYGKFSGKPYRDAIFYPTENGKYLMDVKQGITLSLTSSGVPPQQIGQSSLCTRCETGRLPSYRREPQNPARIFNFLQLL